jgi:hypothetical protein
VLFTGYNEFIITLAWKLPGRKSRQGRKTMSIKSELEASLKDAMRSGDEVRKRTVRMAIAAIRMAEVEQSKVIDDLAAITILQKEVKSRQEAIADAKRAHRPELEAAAEAEITVLESFLPQPFTSAELEALARGVIDEAGAASLAELGKVMKLLTPRLQGRATGSQASQMVRQLLQNL